MPSCLVWVALWRRTAAPVVAGTARHVAVATVLLVLAERCNGAQGRAQLRVLLQPDRAALRKRRPDRVTLNRAVVGGATVTAARGAALVVDLLGLGRELGGAGGGRSWASDGGQGGALEDRGPPGSVGGAIVGDVHVCEGAGAGGSGARRGVADEVKGLAPVTGAAGLLTLVDRALHVLVVVPNDACVGDGVVVHAAGAALDELPGYR